MEPVTYKLNPEASQSFMDARNEINRLTQLQIALLIGAGIPPEERNRSGIMKDGIIEFPPKLSSPESPLEQD